MSESHDFLAELDREIAHESRHGTWPAYIVRALLQRPDCTEKQDALKAIRSDCENPCDSCSCADEPLCFRHERINRQPELHIDALERC